MATKWVPRARSQVSTPLLVMIFRGESVSGHPGARTAPIFFKNLAKTSKLIATVWKLLLDQGWPPREAALRRGGGAGRRGVRAVGRSQPDLPGMTANSSLFPYICKHKKSKKKHRNIKDNSKNKQTKGQRTNKEATKKQHRHKKERTKTNREHGKRKNKGKCENLEKHGKHKKAKLGGDKQ